MNIHQTAAAFADAQDAERFAGELADRYGFEKYGVPGLAGEYLLKAMTRYICEAGNDGDETVLQSLEAMIRAALSADLGMSPLDRIFLSIEDDDPDDPTFVLYRTYALASTQVKSDALFLVADLLMREGGR